MVQGQAAPALVRGRCISPAVTSSQLVADEAPDKLCGMLLALRGRSLGTLSPEVARWEIAADPSLGLASMNVRVPRSGLGGGRLIAGAHALADTVDRRPPTLLLDLIESTLSSNSEEATALSSTTVPPGRAPGRVSKHGDDRNGLAAGENANIPADHSSSRPFRLLTG